MLACEHNFEYKLELAFVYTLTSYVVAGEVLHNCGKLYPSIRLFECSPAISSRAQGSFYSDSRVVFVLLLYGVR
jgi:hypothetical protein